MIETYGCFNCKYINTNRCPYCRWYGFISANSTIIKPLLWEKK